MRTIVIVLLLLPSFVWSNWSAGVRYRVETAHNSEKGISEKLISYGIGVTDKLRYGGWENLVVMGSSQDWNIGHRADLLYNFDSLSTYVSLGQTSNMKHSVAVIGYNDNLKDSIKHYVDLEASFTPILIGLESQYQIGRRVYVSPGVEFGTVRTEGVLTVASEYEKTGEKAGSVQKLVSWGEQIGANLSLDAYLVHGRINFGTGYYQIWQKADFDILGKMDSNYNGFKFYIGYTLEI